MERYYADKYNLDIPRSTPEAADSDAAPTYARPKNGKHRYARDKKRGKPEQQREIYSRRRPPKKKMTKGKKAIVALVSVVILGVIASASYVVLDDILSNYNNSQEFSFSDNVKIGGIDVGGMSYKDAKAELQKNSQYIVPDFTIEITANDEECRFTKKDFEYTFDFKTALDSAKIYSLKEQGNYEEPKTTEKVTEATAATELEKDDYVNFVVEYDVVASTLKSKIAKFSKVIDTEPVNASITSFHPFSGKRFSYKKGSVGYKLQQDELFEEILTFIRSGKSKKKIEATVEVIEPDITLLDLKTKIVGLSTATSISYNNKNANTNMAVALKACNGSVIKPGEIWSFNDCTGDSNDASNGYKKATVIVEGKYEEGVGGGICQASTTIFNAALFANTAIIERNNHFWASDYAFAGEDATIDYPNLDLRFQNTTSYPMFLECKMEGTVLTANIWGVQEDYYDNVKITTENYDIQKKKEYKTVTKRTLYLNGEIVREEEVCYSFYSLTDNHSLRDDDDGTFRTTVDGETKTESDPVPEPEPEAEQAAEEPNTEEQIVEEQSADENSE